MIAFEATSAFEKAINAKIAGALGGLLASDGLSLTPTSVEPEGASTRSKEHKEFVRIQREMGDWFLDGPHGRKSCEWKVEERATRNIFWETWSNFTKGPMAREGWGVTCPSDELWYGVVQARAMVRLDLNALRDWLYRPVSSGAPIEKFAELRQAKRSQKNLSLGKLVPWASIPESCFIEAYLFSPDWGEARSCSWVHFKSQVDMARRGVSLPLWIPGNASMSSGVPPMSEPIRPTTSSLVNKKPLPGVWEGEGPEGDIVTLKRRSFVTVS